uniref:Uncharacterized protein n=1 Tax=Rhizophora mucronata TaxID=61149 RepID=A0A2P2Q0S7_RHIMU
MILCNSAIIPSPLIDTLFIHCSVLSIPSLWRYMILLFFCLSHLIKVPFCVFIW